LTARLSIVYIPKEAAGEYAELALNPWIGCKHGCSYCYVPRHFNMTREDALVPDLKINMLGKLERDLMLLASGIPLEAKCGKDWVEVPPSLENRQVSIMFGGDLYSPPEGYENLPRKILEAFNSHKVPFSVLTKAGSIAFMDFDLYTNDCRFGSTLTFDNDVDSLKWEPGAALPSDRIKALKIAHDDYRIKTWASLEPVIIPEQSLHLIDLTHEFVDHYGVGKLNHNPELEKTIDCHKYLADAEALLKGYGKSYKIKKALAEAGR
jgi:DNA repair photolyase